MMNNTVALMLSLTRVIRLASFFSRSSSWYWGVTSRKRGEGA
jgi:hypothetical protein